MRDFRASIKDDETVTQPLNRAPGAVTSAGGGFGGGVTMPVDGFSGGETIPITRSYEQL